jgi:hypothetical protein
VTVVLSMFGRRCQKGAGSFATYGAVPSPLGEVTVEAANYLVRQHGRAQAYGAKSAVSACHREMGVDIWARRNTGKHREQER